MGDTRAGYFAVRRYQKWRADKKQTEYITKVSSAPPATLKAERNFFTGAGDTEQSFAKQMQIPGHQMMQEGQSASISHSTYTKSDSSLHTGTSSAIHALDLVRQAMRRSLLCVRAQYYNNESVVKPHNPYAPSRENTGFNSRLEKSALDRGMGSLSMTDNGRLASINRTHSIKSTR